MSSSHKLFKLDSKNYSCEELKTNYKKLAIQNHPDKGGDPDFFNYITEQFNKLAIELKNRDNNRNHFDLKNNYESSIKKNTSVNNLSADETFHSKFNKSFFPYMSNLWNNLEVSTQLMALPDFKDQLKKELKPVKIKHFFKGSKIGNTFQTRIRLERSD